MEHQIICNKSVLRDRFAKAVIYSNESQETKFNILRQSNNRIDQLGDDNVSIFQLIKICEGLCSLGIFKSNMGLRTLVLYVPDKDKTIIKNDQLPANMAMISVVSFDFKSIYIPQIN